MNAKTYILIVSIAGMVAAGACGKKDKENTYSENLQVDVAYPVVDSLVLHNDYPGYVSATNQADVVARVSGSIVKQCYKDGAYVKAGEPLFIIESTNYVDKVNAAEAALQTALATNEYAAKNYEAMKRALESDAVSKMDVNQAESSLRESEASIKSARAELQTARTLLGYCTVRAPFSGRATASVYTAGAYVAGEGAPVTMCKIYDDDKVYVKFAIEEPRYLELTQSNGGKAVDLNHVPVMLNDTVCPYFYGKLNYEAPDVDKSTGTVNLRLVVDNSNHFLKDGMFATVKLPYDVDSNAVVISDAAISTDQLGKYIYVVNDSNKVVYNPIKVGELYQDTLRIVTSGLSPSQRYITKAMLKVRDGMTVKPVMTSGANKASAKTNTK